MIDVRRVRGRASGCLSGLVVLSAALAAGTGLPAEASGKEPQDRPQVGLLTANALDPVVPTPESVLGQPVADRPVRYDMLVRYLSALAEASKRVTLTAYGQTHEGRTLYYLTITSESNHQRLPEIQQQNARLADPRKLSEDPATAAREAERIIESLPAIAWLAYSIHGDELSPMDAAIQVAYELAAGTDSATAQLLDELVVHIDPLMNPDGRERFLSQLQHLGGKVPNSDYQAMQHRGLWSAGRGNHYLFDMNRDWLMQVHPETRGRAAAMLAWNPHLVVDAHEMSGLDTYLFSPPREPINTYLSQQIQDWRGRFAADHARSFDQHGWSYYTREWNEEWYPGYTNAWAGLLGAVSILYEQARAAGASVMQEAGLELTYHHAVQQQVVSSMANLESLRTGREELLRDFLADRQWAVSDQGPHNEIFLLEPMADRDRHARFVELMHRQGVEVSVADESFDAQGAVDIWGQREAARTFAAGTLIIRSNQPHRRLLHAMLAFDPHISMEALTEERRRLERRQGSHIYDVTAWNLPMAFGLPAWWAEQCGEVGSSPVSLSEPQFMRRPVASEDKPQYGYVIDAADSSIYQYLVRLFEQDCRPRVAMEPFTLAGRQYAAGAVLLRGSENPQDLPRILQDAAEGLTIDIVAVDTALSDDGPDLGGRRFRLLQPPRVAIASEWPMRTTSFGSAWFWLDARINLRVSPINVQFLRSIDLRKYNVLVLPEVVRADSLAGVLGDEGIQRIKTWVKAGGTLIAVGTSAQFIASKDRGLSAVRLRQDVLDQLPVYAEAVGREEAARQITVDPEAVWGTPRGLRASSPHVIEEAASLSPAPGQQEVPEGVETASQDPDSPPVAASGPERSVTGPKPDIEALKRADEWQRIFSPRGAILAATMDTEHWLCFGLPDRLPVLFGGSACYMARHPVQIPVRLAAEHELRLSGLCWPEARERIAHSAYVTVESLGHGQIILFAGDPTFRGYFEAPARMFLSAVILGPGVGTSTPLPW